MNKSCSKCNTTKSIHDFAIDKTHKDGHRSICKKCISQYMMSYAKHHSDEISNKRKSRYQTNRENELQKNKENRIKNGWKWEIKRRENHRKNPINMMIMAAKRRAKSKNMEFNLSPQDFTLPEKCPVLGIPLHVSDTGNACDNSPTLDRIDNSKGYIKDNVVIVSFRANTIKNVASVEELEKVCNFYKERKNGKIF